MYNSFKRKSQTIIQKQENNECELAHIENSD